MRAISICEFDQVFLVEGWFDDIELYGINCFDFIDSSSVAAFFILGGGEQAYSETHFQL